MILSSESRLTLHPIEIRKDKKNYIVEDKVTGDFFEMPDICISTIKMIEDGFSFPEIERVLLAEYPNEEVNLIDFANQLIELELVQEVDGIVLDNKNKKDSKLGFLWIPTTFGRLFFNKFSTWAYVLLLVSNIWILATEPQLIPHYKDLFVFDGMVFNIILYLVVTFLLVLIHEFGHVLAMRAAGLPTKLDVGHRLFFVVLETDMSSVWKLPAKNRNILYLAGLCFDNVMLFLSLLVAIIFPDLSDLLLGISGVIVFDVIIRMIFQCCIYMKTDLYFVFENISGCYNLLENAQNYFKQKLFYKKAKLKTEMFPGEKRVVISYGIFYLIGMAITMSMFFVYYIPQLIYLLKITLPGLVLPYTDLHFWDSFVTILQLIFGIGLLLYSWRKSYIIQRGQR